MRKAAFLALLFLALVFFLRFVVGGNEDSWICVDGGWVKHGKPSAPKPTTPCWGTLTEDKILTTIPEGSFLRDYEKLPGVDNSYLLIYVLPGYKTDSWDLSCPGEILGDSIIGRYHLALIQDEKLRNNVAISGYEKDGTLELTYKNYIGGWPKLNEKKEKQVIKLLEMKDFTGDGKPYEFLLTTTAGGCGFL